MRSSLEIQAPSSGINVSSCIEVSRWVKWRTGSPAVARVLNIWGGVVKFGRVDFAGALRHQTVAPQPSRVTHVEVVMMA